MTFADLMVSLTASITARVCTTLGIGLVSYSVLDTLAQNFVDLIWSNYVSIDPTVLVLSNMLGVGEAIKIRCAAIVTRASFMSLKRLAVLPSTVVN